MSSKFKDCQPRRSPSEILLYARELQNTQNVNARRSSFYSNICILLLKEAFRFFPKLTKRNA